VLNIFFDNVALDDIVRVEAQEEREDDDCDDINTTLVAFSIVFLFSYTIFNKK
jgi:hypothetical protein